MRRTCLVANTSIMPVAAREASMTTKRRKRFRAQPCLTRIDPSASRIGEIAVFPGDFRGGLGIGSEVGGKRLWIL